MGRGSGEGSPSSSGETSGSSSSSSSCDSGGDFGPGTESAVRSFQSDKGLDADGIVGRETWAALRGTE